ncbi:MAG TPA: hypothetical protein VLT17_06200 [Gemmatimonadales bacterium]|nr:hypothetical protein [Gemmatimonadales bacterium]
MGTAAARWGVEPQVGPGVELAASRGSAEAPRPVGEAVVAPASAVVAPEEAVQAQG